MKIKETLAYKDDDGFEGRFVCCLTEDSTPEHETVMSSGGFNARPTRYAGGYVPTLTIGGVATPVLYRRQGCVRQMLETMLPKARENGWYVSLLHPFSFSFYRKFGYERVSDHILVDFPISALDFLPREMKLVPMDASRLQDVAEVYEAFSQNRNLMFKRKDADRYPINDTYIYYNAAGHPEGYIVLKGINHYDGINRMVSDNLHIHEMAYLTPEALRHLLSFVRMFEGELDTVHIHDIALLPEVDLMLKHYMHTRYDIHPDIMARILDTEAMLKANTYPAAHGVFTLRVEDWLDSVRGCFRVEYQDGHCQVERLSDTSPADITTQATSLARFLYGTDAFDARLASYMDGVTLGTPAEDFFRAFPKRINGIFEHF